MNSNAENETQGVWGNKEACWYSLNPNSYQGIGQASSGVRRQPLRAGRTDWKGANTTGKSTTTPGGMLVQLIEETEQEINDYQERIDKLHNRLDKFRTLLKQLELDSE